MTTRVFLSSTWAYVMLGGVAVPAVVAIAFLTAHKPEVAGEIGVLTAIYAGLMALGTYTTVTAKAPDGAATDIAAEWAIPSLAIEGIEWIDAVPMAPPSPATLRVTKVTGACSHGFLPGNSWVVDSKGNLSRPICAAIASAFTSLYQVSSGKDMPQEISCRCPLGNGEVVFKVKTKE